MDLDLNPSPTLSPCMTSVRAREPSAPQEVTMAANSEWFDLKNLQESPVPQCVLINAIPS